MMKWGRFFSEFQNPNKKISQIQKYPPLEFDCLLLTIDIVFFSSYVVLPSDFSSGMWLLKVYTWE